jgi:hypothetical protein
MFVFVHPIGRPAIVTVEPVFIFTSEWHGIDEERRRLDRIPVEADIKLRTSPLLSLVFRVGNKNRESLHSRTYFKPNSPSYCRITP